MGNTGSERSGVNKIKQTTSMIITLHKCLRCWKAKDKLAALMYRVIWKWSVTRPDFVDICFGFYHPYIFYWKCFLLFLIPVFFSEWVSIWYNIIIVDKNICNTQKHFLQWQQKVVHFYMCAGTSHCRFRVKFKILLVCFMASYTTSFLIICSCQCMIVKLVAAFVCLYHLISICGVTMYVHAKKY